MAFNGAGVFSRIYSWVADKTNGINITASRMDTDSNDIAAAFNNCVTRDNQGKPSANFLASADASFDIGSSSVHWRDGWFSRNLSVGGTLAATGNVSLAGTLSVTGTTTLSAGISGTTASFSGTMTAAGIATGANDSSGRGIPVARYVSVTNDNVTNSIALITDSYLQLALAAGVYEFEIAVYNGGSSSAGGLRLQMAFSGTATSSGWQAIGESNGTAQTVGRQAFGAPVIWANTWGTTDFVLIKGSIQVTVSGTLSLQWAQQAANATATNLGVTSYLKVTQLS